MSGDLSKTDLYEGVKTLVESENKHLNLSQQKLFTLFSIGFQYLLFQSTKKPGAYIIRVEDGILADKLAKKSKDPSTRKFIQSILIPRKLKFDKSVFYLDYFHFASWNLTNDIPKDRIQAAIIIKNTSMKPMLEISIDDESDILNNLPPDHHLTTLTSIVPKVITIGMEKTFDDATDIIFPFIKKEKERTVSGVKINEDLIWDDED
jgi:hypothetical protein